MIKTLPSAIVSRMIEESLDAVLVIDEHGEIRYVNSAMQALCGYASGDAVGQPLHGLLPHSFVDHNAGYIGRFLAAAAPTTVLGAVREIAIRHRSGEMIPVEMKGLDLGVVDGRRYYGAFVVDLRPRRLAEARNAALLAQLDRQALSDALTGLPNRRAFEQEAERMVARARRNNAQVTIGIADIDFFKRINDQHGHPVGDEVLSAISAVLAQSARASDVVARIGGEEFGLLFPDATPDMAAAVAERMRTAVEAFPVVAAGGLQIKVTISIGLAPCAGALSEALSQADRALYTAKGQGRNRVERS